jgi:hypothetical protein
VLTGLLIYLATVPVVLTLVIGLCRDAKRGDEILKRAMSDRD